MGGSPPASVEEETHTASRAKAVGRPRAKQEMFLHTQESEYRHAQGQQAG
jgi:hypothetical protein